MKLPEHGGHFVPDVRQEAVGSSLGAALSQLELDVVLQPNAEVFQVQVVRLQVPGEATLQLQQSGVKRAAGRARAAYWFTGLLGYWVTGLLSVHQ